MPDSLPAQASSRAPGALARSPSVSVIVPTYREVDNIPHLLARLGELRRTTGLDLEVVLMDDDSRDGSVEAVDHFGADWARIVVRTENRGLSAAVVDGFAEATRDVVVVMDADLSHPPEKIPAMLLALQGGQQFVVGSRYVEGGSTDDDWGIFRWLNSVVATALAWPLTNVADPMSGFFAFWRRDLSRARRLDPVGYKIGLELIVRCHFTRVAEVPIHFADRRFGTSKLTLREQLKYIQHLRRLYVHKFGVWSDLAQFCVVGAIGLLVNLGVLSGLLAAGTPYAVALAAGIAVSMVSNFVLNRRFTFSYARDGSVWRQFLGFVSASSVGAAVSYFTALAVRPTLGDGAGAPQIAAVVGVLAGTLFNFLANRFLVFRKERVRPKRR